jgi:hypothetical protein
VILRKKRRTTLNRPEHGPRRRTPSGLAPLIEFREVTHSTNPPARVAATKQVLGDAKTGGDGFEALAECIDIFVGRDAHDEEMRLNGLA